LNRTKSYLIGSLVFVAGVAVGVVAANAGDRVVTTETEACSQILNRCDVTEYTWLVREDRWNLVGMREYTRPLPPPPPPHDDLPPKHQN